MTDPISDTELVTKLRDRHAQLIRDCAPASAKIFAQAADRLESLLGEVGRYKHDAAKYQEALEALHAQVERLAKPSCEVTDDNRNYGSPMHAGGARCADPDAGGLHDLVGAEAKGKAPQPSSAVTEEELARVLFELFDDEIPWERVSEHYRGKLVQRARAVLSHLRGGSTHPSP